jgi:predicted HTH domain antitoxin
MSVISLRLKDRELKRINELSRMVHKDKSTIARELIEYGWEFLMIKLYREGKMSLGTLSSKLELSVSETIDLLAEFGVESPIDYEDYLKGFDVFKVK